MPSYQEMKERYGSNDTIGQRIKTMSDNAMQQTWDNDIQTRLCYIYDYYHDNNADKRNGYDPSLAPEGYKIPVWCKFIVKEYKSAAKDDPEYHLQFSPDDWNSQSMIPDYWKKNYKKFDIHFPIGLFVDIPDDLGVYHKWLIFYDEVANQFPKFGVMKCNYQFRWVYDKDNVRYKRAMWGVQRTQNSYNSGVYRYNVIEKLENQSKFWLPWNSISSEIYYNQRMIVSMPMERPLVYRITKVENTVPKGINMITLYQDEFNPDTDYVDLSTGEMYADYYEGILPTDKDMYLGDAESPSDNSDDDNDTHLEVTCKTNTIKIGGSYKTLSAKCVRGVNTDVTTNYKNFAWSYSIDGEDASQFIETATTDLNNQIKIKFLDDNTDDYIQRELVITCICETMTQTINLMISTL